MDDTFATFAFAFRLERLRNCKNCDVWLFDWSDLFVLGSGGMAFDYEKEIKWDQFESWREFPIRNLQFGKFEILDEKAQKHHLSIVLRYHGMRIRCIASWLLQSRQRCRRNIQLLGLHNSFLFAHANSKSLFTRWNNRVWSLHKHQRLKFLLLVISLCDLLLTNGSHHETRLALGLNSYSGHQMDSLFLTTGFHVWNLSKY